MSNTTNHWTNESIDDFQHSVASDFIGFIEDAMEREGVTQTQLAARLGVSEGRVSQVLNNPGNLTLRKIIEYVRALKKKVAIVGYDDGDADNRSGPVRAQIFSKSWERIGKPMDFFAFERCDKLLMWTGVSAIFFMNPGRTALTDDASVHLHAFVLGHQSAQSAQ